MKDNQINSIIFDKFLIFDIFFAFINFAICFYMFNYGQQFFIDDLKSPYLDMLASVVVAVALIRIFLYFLLIGNISKMLLTLFYMVIDVIPFTLIFVCYLFFVA